MPESPTVYYLVAAAVTVAAAGSLFLLLAGVAFVQWNSANAARRWPAAEGTILESRVDTSKSLDGGWDYRSLVSYRYEVGGQVYTNNVLALGSRYLWRSGPEGERRAREAVARYPAGSPVAVRHHPQRPADSVLEVRSATARHFLVLGAVSLLVGIIIAAFLLIAAATQ